MEQQLKRKLYEIIFEADTREGRLFDLILLGVIVLSVILVILESVSAVDQQYHRLLRVLEWVITIIFSIEYVLRIYVLTRPLKYIFSFYGIVDLLSVMPSYIALFLADGHSLVVIRILRLLRIFRILKLNRYSQAGQLLSKALWNSRSKIGVFLFFILNIVIIVGTMMYLIEGPENGFKSIPTSIYWSIVTLTTVGYGDISPATPLGQFLASLLMVAGYAIIAVPTGIITSEMMKPSKKDNTQVCPNCHNHDNEDDAVFCKKCGEKLNE